MVRKECDDIYYHKFVYALDVYLQVCKEAKDDKEKLN